MIDVEDDSDSSPVEITQFTISADQSKIVVDQVKETAIQQLISQSIQRSISRILCARDWLEIVDKCTNHSDRLYVYEQAISQIPQSWKVWRSYLSYARQHAEQYPIHHPVYQSTNLLHERCLMLLSRIPRAWQDYATFLTQQCLFTRARVTLNRALSTLPITQHALWIWPTMNQSVKQSNCPDAIANMLKRQAHADPLKREELIDWLIDAERYNEACHCLIDCMVDGTFMSAKGRSMYDLFEMFLSLVMHHGACLDQSIDVEAILNQSINQFPEAAGRCQTALAAYFLRRGLIEKARSIFDQSINHSRTVKDFVLIFNAYTKFLESLVNQSINQSVIHPSADNDAAADLAMERLDRLIDSRPLLINACYLRQNPNNVDRWIERVSIYQSVSQSTKMIETLSTAVSTVDINHCVGSHPISHLWLMLASIYLSNNDLASARTVFTTALTQPFNHVSDLVDLVSAQCEIELMHDNINEARSLLERFCTSKSSVSSPAHSRINQSIILWCLLADLEEQHGSLATVTSVFNSMLKHGLCTVRLSLHHAHWLRFRRRYEESFRWSERCLAVITPSHQPVNPTINQSINQSIEAAARIWLDYLKAIWTRTFKSTNNQSINQSVKQSHKLTIMRERIRDLFESCFKQISPLLAGNIKSSINQSVNQSNAQSINQSVNQSLVLRLCLLWARWEQQYGTHRRCLIVLNQSINQSNSSLKFIPCLISIAMTQSFYGRQRTRELIDWLIDCSDRLTDWLIDSHCSLLLCLFADWECKCGEIERARALFRNAATCCDPRINQSTNQSIQNPWIRWSEFEVQYGDQSTYREMLRIKRAVTQLFATRIKYVDQSVSQSINRSIQQIFHNVLSLKGLTTKSSTQSISQSVDQSINQSHVVQDSEIHIDDEFGDQSINQSVNQSALKNPDEIEIDDLDD